MTQTTTTYQIRKARKTEAAAIRDLFIEEVKAGRMLPRKINEIRDRIGDWQVAVDSDKVIGCVSLVYFNPRVCELRSLAVSADYQGNGLGGLLIQAAVEMARQQQMQRVLTLTRAVRLFEREGFHIDRVLNFPEKVWQDCRACPLRNQCDEVALVYELVEGETE